LVPPESRDWHSEWLFSEQKAGLFDRLFRNGPRYTAILPEKWKSESSGNRGNLEDIYSARSQQGHDHEGYQGLKHHAELRPARQDGSIRWGKSGTGVKGKK